MAGLQLGLLVQLLAAAAAAGPELVAGPVELPAGLLTPWHVAGPVLPPGLVAGPVAELLAGLLAPGLAAGPVAGHVVELLAAGLPAVPPAGLLAAGTQPEGPEGPDWKEGPSSARADQEQPGPS